jgi:hypothetical protein
MIDSGNGIQVLWRLVEPIELAENSANNIADVEPRNKAVMECLRTVVGTQNIDRILRPGRND